MLEVFELRGQFHFPLDSLFASQHGDPRLVARIAAAQFLFDIGGAGDRSAVDLDDAVVGLESGGGGGALGATGGNDRLAGEKVGALHHDARQSGIEVFAFFQPRQHLLDVLRGDGEADSRVVPIDAGDFIGSLRREGHQHAEYAAADVHQRSAVVVRRDGGVGLDGLAPDAIDRAEDAHRRIDAIALEGPADGDRPLAGPHLAERRDFARRQRAVGINL